MGAGPAAEAAVAVVGCAMEGIVGSVEVRAVRARACRPDQQDRVQLKRLARAVAGCLLGAGMPLGVDPLQCSLPALTVHAPSIPAAGVCPKPSRLTCCSGSRSGPTCQAGRGM